MEEWDVQEEHQAPDDVQIGVAEEPVIPEMVQVMRWIGFDEVKAGRVAAQIGGRICHFAEFSHWDVKILTESLRGLSSNIRIHVSLAQAKKIKASIDWVKDQDRANKTPSIGGLDEESFLIAIRESTKREVSREAAKENAETLAKAASPGKLTGEKVWDKWKAGLENQLSMLYSVKGAPLVYIIRENEQPEEGKTYASFTQECIEKCSGFQYIHQNADSYTGRTRFNASYLLQTLSGSPTTSNSHRWAQFGGTHPWTYDQIQGKSTTSWDFHND
jgi:hypothetical protein